MENNKLVEKLKKSGYLKSPEIIEAFEKIDRLNFVIDYLKNDAYLDRPLGIGFGQTISQPITVAFMLELLQAKKGDNVLDIGSGSGWQAALICQIIGEKGKLHGIEIIPELYEFGKKNLEKYDFVKKGIAELYNMDGYNGLEKEAPFDKIIAAAAPQEGIPPQWKEQLKIGGRLVFPMNDSLWLLKKISENKFEEKEYKGYVFVPLIRGKE
jgi:protein-L-isoaspartate(D-aspartate) O-methyltransferase